MNLRSPNHETNSQTFLSTRDLGEDREQERTIVLRFNEADAFAAVATIGDNIVALGTSDETIEAALDDLDEDLESPESREQWDPDWISF